MCQPQRVQNNRKGLHHVKLCVWCHYSLSCGYSFQSPKNLSIFLKLNRMQHTHLECSLFDSYNVSSWECKGLLYSWSLVLPTVSIVTARSYGSFLAELQIYIIIIIKMNIYIFKCCTCCYYVEVNYIYVKQTRNHELVIELYMYMFIFFHLCWYIWRIF